MSYIFMDESGDLGFDFSKSRTTRYFVITFLFAPHKRPIEKVVRSVHRGLHKKFLMRTNALQAVDFASWTIFRKYEYGDRTYYEILKPKIVEENPLFA